MAKNAPLIHVFCDSVKSIQFSKKKPLSSMKKGQGNTSVAKAWSVNGHSYTSFPIVEIKSPIVKVHWVGYVSSTVLAAADGRIVEIPYQDNDFLVTPGTYMHRVTGSYINDGLIESTLDYK